MKIVPSVLILLCFLLAGISFGQLDRSLLEGNWKWKNKGELLKLKRVPASSMKRPFLRFTSHDSVFGFYPYTYCGNTPRKKMYTLGDGKWSLNDSSNLVFDLELIPFSVKAEYEILKLSNGRMVLRRISYEEGPRRYSYNVEKILEKNDVSEAINQLDNGLREKSRFGKEMDSLTDKERTFVFVSNLVKEVNNGGFKIYYLSSSADFAMETYDALIEIGAIETARILKKANDEWPNGIVESDSQIRRNLWLEMEQEPQEVWNACDDEFFVNVENIPALLMNYVRANKSFFMNQ